MKLPAIMESNDKKTNLWPIVIGAGALALLIKAFSGGSRKSSSQNSKKKIFISFAIEDVKYRDFLVAQAKNERTPFEFIDKSVKEPWDDAVWQRRCRLKIRSCDGVIVLLSKNTWHSSGVRWEIKCAKEEEIPVIGMHIKKRAKGAIPPELKGRKVITWSWDNLADVIDEI
jgi:hypothetical protein